ncbi:MAG TPA: CapA family protein [Bacillota bacterium]|nr:CapA family protein [Bacillota bacterium]
MKTLQRLSLVLIMTLLFITLASCSLDFRDQASESPTPIGPGFTPGPILEPTPEPPRGTTSLKLRAVGDILMHMPLVNAASTADGYDFRHFFDDIKPYLEGADIAMANLETTISNNEKGYGGYPMFRTPEEILGALSYAGFNLITTANNHSFDGREFGVVNTLDKLDQYGLMYTGTARSQEERDSLLLIEENDIRVGVLAYTYGTNGMEVTIPESKRGFMVNLIDKDMIKDDVKRARGEGAEVIIVAIHWGDEYARNPNSNQEELADFLISLGVDVIMGSHPHVLQPIEKRRVELEDGKTRDVVLVYSLGNFISNQIDNQLYPEFQYTDSGAIVELDIVKDYDQDKIYLDNIAYTPTWVYRYGREGGYDYRVLPVGSYIDEDLGSVAQQRINEVWNETTNHLGSEDFTIIE